MYNDGVFVLQDQRGANSLHKTYVIYHQSSKSV
jgi:hypothetical protein